ncbi:ABC transporter permease subunit [Breoghania sp.]|uniref:ABC transporter permease n=1 Tax=Breoghania sp. TaxID=2065378 RepID=UPI002614F006|nr:ABC transporter permease subunit [Breoghania sp.]MDJ0933501.1 ABC transporter permease subunit [Breoghania sp.]
MPPRSGSRAWKKLKRNRSVLVGLVLVVFFIIIALAAPLLPVPDPAATSWSAVRKAPSASHFLVQATLTLATAIIAEASLSFLGLGQQPISPSWGSTLNVAKNFLTQAPWMAWWPGAAIFLVVLGFNLLGDSLRDALDPRES